MGPLQGGLWRTAAVSSALQLVHYFVIICVYLTLRSRAQTLSLDSIRLPNGEVQRPAQAPYYDVPSGSTLVFLCTGSGALNISADKLPAATTDRFSQVTSTSRDSTANLTAHRVVYTDTGLVVCRSAGSQTNSSLYIFVNDPINTRLPVQGGIALGEKRPGVVPCLSTYSNATVLATVDGRSMQGIIFNMQKGFEVASPGKFHGGMWQCTVTAAGRTNVIRIIVRYIEAIGSPPSITTQQGGTYFSIGQTLVLNCVVYSNCNLTWACPATGAAVCNNPPRITATGPQHNRSTGSTQSSLTITDLTIDDTGTYNCIASTIFESTEASETIQVLDKGYVRPANLSREQKTKEVQKDESVEFSIILEGHPLPNVTWFFGDRPLTDSTKYMIVVPLADDSTGGQGRDINHITKLDIMDVQPEDAGIYTMRAKAVNVQGEVDEQVDTLFTLVVLVRPSVSLFVEYQGATDSATNEPKYVYPDKDVKLRCKVTGGSPAPSLQWFWQPCQFPNCSPDKVNHQRIAADPAESHLLPNQPDVIGDSSDQTLKVKMELSGIYVCYASNEKDQNDERYQIILVSEVEKNGCGFPDDISKAGLELVEEDTFNLDCYGLKWLYNSSAVVAYQQKPTSEYPPLTLTTTNNSYVNTLPLRNVTLAMNGSQYRCECGGQAGSTVKLTVKEYKAPAFLLNVTGTYTLSQGETKSFVCKASGSPMPTIRWLKNGRNLINEAHYLLQPIENGSNLTLMRLSPSDSANYTCLAETVRGERLHSYFALTVKAAIPTPPLSTTQIVLISCTIVAVIVIAVIVTVFLVRRYCRKIYTPHGMLLPSKDMINPDIPLDEQTDALPYDIGWEFPFAKLKMGMLLGQGAFGRVLKAEAFGIEEGIPVTTVAVKAVRDTNDMEQIKALISELKILIHIGQHLNIVNLLGACTKDINKGVLLVIVEYCRYGNLRSYLIKHKEHFREQAEKSGSTEKLGIRIGADSKMQDDYLTETATELHSADKPITPYDLVSWSYQIARGMEYLASILYIHRDLAARNVLLCDNNIVKICDFGLAKDIYKYQEYKKETDGPLPIKWMALESLTHKIFNTRTDVWSYGVTIWELFALAATPYPGVDLDETFVERLQQGYRMDKPQHAPEEMYCLMLQCWHPDAEQRPDFAEISNIVGNMLHDDEVKNLSNMEDPYLRSRDSRTDITIRKPTGRTRALNDFNSDYLPALSTIRQSSGTEHDYYNTKLAAAKNKKTWKEKASDEEKLPLHGSMELDADLDLDMPASAAPAPSPWERQSHLAKRARSASFNSLDNEVHPPSYNYIMTKNNNGASRTASNTHLRVDMESRGGQSPSGSSYTETSI